ncbi:MAG: AtpZ/AtpI family protein [Bradyrhizobiaceae bacterium]|nr:AtpZ/AtpI family protein [Bradyrhizobiaceae bacterium]
MADDARNGGDPNDQSSDEAALSARLRRLGERLDLQRAGPTREAASGAPASSERSGLALGLRLSSELVAGVVVGAIIGWALDHWVGISPWGLIVFVLLGFVAGVRNVMRAAATGNAPTDRGS